MGCGNSRLNAAEGEVVPVKIRPLLLRRLEELRKRRNGTTLKVEGTLSKKQLLKDAEEEDDNSQSSKETETDDKVSPKETQPAKKETVVRVITVEKLSRVVPLLDLECETEEEKDPNKGNTEQDNKHKDHDPEKVIHVDEKAETEVKTEEGKTAEPVPEPKSENEQEVDAKSDDDDDDDDNDGEEFGRLLCPGSPSFRIYCIEAEKRKEEECKNQNIAGHQKSPSVDSVESAASGNSGNSNEVLQVVETESTTKRKGNKIKKFGAMKNLLNVKSCYHPMCTCTGEDRSHLLAAKTAK